MAKFKLSEEDQYWISKKVLTQRISESFIPDEAKNKLLEQIKGLSYTETLRLVTGSSLATGI